MTADLEERIERALAARASAITVQRRSLEDLDAAPRSSGRWRARWAFGVAAAVLALVVGAVLLVDRSPEEGVEVGPADTSTTVGPEEVEPVPELEATWSPEGVGSEPTYDSTSPDGLSSVTGWGTSGSRWVVIALSRWNRSPALESGLRASDGPAVATNWEQDPGNPLAGAGGDDGLSQHQQQALEDYLATMEGRPAPGSGEEVTGPVLIGRDVVLVHGRRSGPNEPVGVTLTGLTAFPGADLVLSVITEGLRPEEALAMIDGLRVDGEAAVGEVPQSAPWSGLPNQVTAGAPLPFAGLTTLPDGWVTKGPAQNTPSEGPNLWTYRPVEGIGTDVGVTRNLREITMSIGRQELSAEGAAALDGDDPAAVESAFSWFGAESPPAISTGPRAERVADRWVLITNSSLDANDLGLGNLGVRRSIRMMVMLAPDLTLQVGGEGVTEQEILAALTNVLVVP